MRIRASVATETTSISTPDNQDLQINELSIDKYFAGAITDKVTEKQLDYRALMKDQATQHLWFHYFTNELDR